MYKDREKHNESVRNYQKRRAETDPEYAARKRERLERLDKEKKSDPAKYKAVRKRAYEKIYLKHKRYPGGISHTEYTAMFEAQNGLCAICGKPETVKDKRSNRVRLLAVDHCHITGKVRGLLCTYCNTRLVMIENKELKALAEAYLASFEDL